MSNVDVIIPAVQGFLSDTIFTQIRVNELEEELCKQRNRLANDIFDFITIMTNVRINDIVEIKLKNGKTINAFIKGRNECGGFLLIPFDLKTLTLNRNPQEVEKLSNLNKAVGEKGFIVGNPHHYTLEKGRFNFTLKDSELPKRFNEIPANLLHSGMEIFDFDNKQNTFHSPDVIRRIGRLEENFYYEYKESRLVKVGEYKAI